MNASFPMGFYRSYPTMFGMLFAVLIIWSALLMSDQSFLIYRRDVGEGRMFGTKCTYFGGMRTNSTVRLFFSRQEQTNFSCPVSRLIGTDLPS